MKVIKRNDLIMKVKYKYYTNMFKHPSYLFHKLRKDMQIILDILLGDL